MRNALREMLEEELGYDLSDVDPELNDLHRQLSSGRAPSNYFANAAGLRQDIPQPYTVDMPAMNTMRVESGPNAGRVVSMDFGTQPAQQRREKLGDYIENVGGRRGRYSEDGRSIVYSNGDRESLTPQRDALERKSADDQLAQWLQMGKHKQALRRGEQDLERGDIEIERAREDLAASRRRPAVDPNSQAALEKQFGRAEKDMRWRPDGTLEPLPGGQKTQDANEVIGLLDLADPLVEKATGSYSGAGLDMLGQFFGASSEAGNAAAELKAIQGLLVSKMPKMSGPQSDKDVQLYREMAGRIGDPTVPPGQKRAAMNTIRKINEQYLSQRGAALPQDTQGAPTAARATFQSLPDPAAYAGRRIKGPEGILVSDGTRWVRQ